RHQFSLFLFNYTATTDIYTLSLHDALPIFFLQREKVSGWSKDPISSSVLLLILYIFISLPLVEWPGSVIRNNLSQFVKAVVFFRSEEHTSELQSRENLVCRLLLEKKNSDIE